MEGHQYRREADGQTTVVCVCVWQSQSYKAEKDNLHKILLMINEPH